MEVKFEDIKLYFYEGDNIVEAIKILDEIYHFIFVLDKENYEINRRNYLGSKFLLLKHGSKAIPSQDNKGS